MTDIFYNKLTEYGMGGAADAMAAYADKLLAVNEHMNLTRITDEAEVAVKHFADSAHPDICALIGDNASVIDIGTGGGFPGVPLKLMRQDIAISFMESAAKKLNFVKQTCEELGIEGSFYNERAEEAADKREKYDVAVSRAVASLPILLELCSPFVKVGGRVLAYKGQIAEQELLLAQNAIKKLNLELESSVAVTIEGASHVILVFKKTAKTPKQYPRRYAQIKKSPL